METAGETASEGGGGDVGFWHFGHFWVFSIFGTIFASSSLFLVALLGLFPGALSKYEGNGPDVSE